MFIYKLFSSTRFIRLKAIACLVLSHCSARVFQERERSVRVLSQEFTFVDPQDPVDSFIPTASSLSPSSIHTVHQQTSSPTSSPFLSLWPANPTCETNDDYRTFAQQENEQSSNLEYQQQQPLSVDQRQSASPRIDHLGTRQMSENITTNNGGANGANSSNALSRKKSNNGGDLTASPKYNKSNTRGLNRESQQQKPNRTTNNGRSRQRGQPPPSRVNVDPPWDLHTLDEDNLDDGSGELFAFDDQSVSKRGDNAKKTNMSHLLNFHYLDKQRVNVRGNRRGFNSHFHSHGRWTSGGHASCRQSFSKEQFLQAK